ncbi:MAG: hypothetical protein ABI723_24495 [Bacteroidia bacterium]
MSNSNIEKIVGGCYGPHSFFTVYDVAADARKSISTQMLNDNLWHFQLQQNISEEKFYNTIHPEDSLHVKRYEQIIANMLQTQTGFKTMSDNIEMEFRIKINDSQFIKIRRQSFITVMLHGKPNELAEVWMPKEHVYYRNVTMQWNCEVVKNANELFYATNMHALKIKFTKREIALMQYADYTGLPNKIIARDFKITVKAVEKHFNNITNKVCRTFDIASRTLNRSEMLIHAFRWGLLPVYANDDGMIEKRLTR